MLFYDTYVFAHIKNFVWSILRHLSMYIFFDKPFHATSYIYTHTFFGRILLLPTHKYTYFEKHFYATHRTLCRALHAIYIHIMQGIFMLYIYSYFARHFIQLSARHFIQHFARHSHAIYIYIYTYRWKVFSMLPRCKVFLMGQPNLNPNNNLSNMS